MCRALINFKVIQIWYYKLLEITSSRFLEYTEDIIHIYLTRAIV